MQACKEASLADRWPANACKLGREDTACFVGILALFTHALGIAKEATIDLTGLLVLLRCRGLLVQYVFFVDANVLRRARASDTIVCHCFHLEMGVRRVERRELGRGVYGVSGMEDARELRRGKGQGDMSGARGLRRERGRHDLPPTV